MDQHKSNINLFLTHNTHTTLTTMTFPRQTLPHQRSRVRRRDAMSAIQFDPGPDAPIIWLDLLDHMLNLADSFCQQHDETGALTLVATPTVWNEDPRNVLPDSGGDASAAATSRPRPTFPPPDLPASGGSQGQRFLYEQAVQKRKDFLLASQALKKELLAILGPSLTE